LGGRDIFGNEAAGTPWGICTLGVGLGFTGTEGLCRSVETARLSREEGVGIPAGDATEVGTMKSSKLMGSLGVSADVSTDFLS
jgi:hypothetical protein